MTKKTLFLVAAFMLLVLVCSSAVWAYWYFKPGYDDYAPSGMPDFDQNHPGWTSYCGPTAVANCLWWFDSKFEPGAILPPDSSDGFPLVIAYGPWDDHDTSNVRPLVEDLAARMRCKPGVGTHIDSMQMAIDSLLIERGLQHTLAESTYWMPDFYFIENEIERSQNVILMLGFWYFDPDDGWFRTGGHFVTCAGVKSESLKIAISDPDFDNACEFGNPGRIGSGFLIPHNWPHPGDPITHDDAGNVSHDYYTVVLNSPSPGGTWSLLGYPTAKATDFFGLNVPERFEKYQAKRPPDETKTANTEVEAAVIICPVEEDTLYFKPDYDDYAPSGMPDFDQRQDDWGQNLDTLWIWTHDGPTALANCLWWFDSKYQHLIGPGSPQPPAINDDFSLVWAYGDWDDHDTINVVPLVEDLAWHMNTDGIRTGDSTVGTNVFEMEAAIAEWLLETRTEAIFYKHTKKAPDFYWIEDEIERSQDVILLLGFWQNLGTPSMPNWFRVGGHWVTCAGVNSEKLTLAISDPFYDAAEQGFVGRVRDGILIPHPHGGHSHEVHNDAGNISHDSYTVVYDHLTPGGPWSIPAYPRNNQVLRMLQGANFPPEYREYQVEYDSGLDGHTEIEYAVAISPIGQGWHQKGEYPDYAPDGMPDFDQNQHNWQASCGPAAVANCLWWFDSKYQWFNAPGMPPPPFVQDDFDMITSYIPGHDDHSYDLEGPWPGAYDNVQYLIEDLAQNYLLTDPAWGTDIENMQMGIDQWLMDKGLESLFYEHTLLDSTEDSLFFSIVVEEIEQCQDVILLLGFWEDRIGEWYRVGGHYVTCAGVNSDSMLIMLSDPDYDQQPTDYPHFDPKWHNNAALVSHDVYLVAPSPSPGGYWGLPWYPGDILVHRHDGQNCPAHLKQYEDFWQGGRIYTEIEGAVLISPIFGPPEAVQDLEIYTAFGTALPFTKDIRLIWSPVTADTAGRPITVDSYVIYRDTVPNFWPGPAKELASSGGTTYVDTNIAGDPTVNYFYYVNARKSGTESANSKCVGEFDKDLSDGTKKKGARQGAEIKSR